MLRTAYELSAGMLSFVVAAGLGYWVGHVLDGWLGTAPWAAIVFLVFGLTAGVLNVVRTLRRAMRPPPSGDRPDRSGGGRRR
jgi:F0F1-type ATP synthase assembly protein I